jgi:hypothetical protein
LQFLVPASCRRQLPPGSARLAPAAQLLFTDERVEHVELVRRPCKAPLLELPRHGDQPLAGGAQVFARCSASPRVGARTTVGEHPPRHDEPVLLARA